MDLFLLVKYSCSLIAIVLMDLLKNQTPYMIHIRRFIIINSVNLWRFWESNPWPSDWQSEERLLYLCFALFWIKRS